MGKRLPWFSIWASVWFGKRLKGQSQWGSGQLTQNSSRVRQSIATYRQHGTRPECPLHPVEPGWQGVCYAHSEDRKPRDPGRRPALQPRPHWLGCEWTVDKPGGCVPDALASQIAHVGWCHLLVLTCPEIPRAYSFQVWHMFTFPRTQGCLRENQATQGRSETSTPSGPRGMALCSEPPGSPGVHQAATCTPETSEHTLAPTSKGATEWEEHNLVSTELSH